MRILAEGFEEEAQEEEEGDESGSGEKFPTMHCTNYEVDLQKYYVYIKNWA